MPFAVRRLAMSVVVIVEEEIFISAISRESHRCDSQARECTFETIPSCERTGVAPCLTVEVQVSHVPKEKLNNA